MARLIDCVDLVANNKDCVVLKVKPNKEMDLICLGCFDGNETMFRMTKGDSNTYTIFSEGGGKFSWHNGLGGYTVVSDKVNECRRYIAECITEDLGIYMGKYCWGFGEYKRWKNKEF